MNDGGIPQIRLRAFVGRSFLESDEKVWQDFRNILESLRAIGLEFEDAKGAELKPISEKVRQGIERNDLYIAILTRRSHITDDISKRGFFSRIVLALQPPMSESKWTTSHWIVQESGYALGKGRRVLLLIEQGVDFPSTDLDADTEWIPFERTAIASCGSRLVSMITNLISKTLPPITETNQVAPPVVAIVDEEKRDAPAQDGDFHRVVQFLDEGEFQYADEEFQKFMGSDTNKPLDRWFRFFYLRLKAVRGHSSSLDELKNTVKSEPNNLDARVELSRYYSHFNDHSNAIQILTTGDTQLDETEKGRLLREVADELAKDDQYDNALNTITNLIRSLSIPGQLRLSYIALADLAKEQSDRELESAALEHVLDFDQADSAIRFRLAFLYSEMNKRGLSAYHYQFRLNQGKDDVSLNNIGVAYGALELPGKEILSFEKAADNYWLAKANLSHAYIDRGFLVRAEQLASEVIKADCDETARNRAIGAHGRISTIRSNEKETAERIFKVAKAERVFRSAYAAAFAGLNISPLNGIFETPHGPLLFSQDGRNLFADGQFEVEVSRGLFFALSGGSPASTKVRTVHIEAAVVGRSGRFKLEIRIADKIAGPVPPESKTINGLLILDENGQSCEFMEEHEKEVHIYKATKA